jgi:hypothetical protein
MNISHILVKLSPGSAESRKNYIIILFAEWTAVNRIYCLQDLGHGAAKIQSVYKQRDLFIHQKLQPQMFA